MDTLIFLGLIPVIGFIFALILDFEKKKKVKRIRSVFLLILSVLCSLYFIKSDTFLEYFLMIFVSLVFYIISFFTSQDMFDKD